MKAIVYDRYGPPEVLEVREIAKPAPKDNEVLIKIHATTVTAGDWRARSLIVPAGFKLLSRLFFGFSKPKRSILGTELAGEIEAVGRAVHKFKVGDRVFAFPDADFGAYAGYRCMPEDMRYLAELARAGEFRPVIDRTYPFERIVEAHRYMDTGRKRGNVVITVAGDPFNNLDLPGNSGYIPA